jgi:hypothetical protein
VCAVCGPVEPWLLNTIMREACVSSGACQHPLRPPHRKPQESCIWALEQALEGQRAAALSLRRLMPAQEKTAST